MIQEQSVACSETTIFMAVIFWPQLNSYSFLHKLLHSFHISGRAGLVYMFSGLEFKLDWSFQAEMPIDFYLGYTIIHKYIYNTIQTEEILCTKLNIWGHILADAVKDRNVIWFMN